ncbi:MAG: hypothetical protein M9904_18425 [Chitinophagaceae bacterium]|nr:hypothetical protein [Chitinophagaceae bacterium]
MKINFFLFLIAVVFSCSNSTVVNDGKWEIVKGKGIDPANKLFYFLSFPQKGYGLMFGSSYSDESLLKKVFTDFNAIYYFSNDGGLNWVEKGLGKGKFSSYATKNNYVLLCKELKREGVKMDSTVIYYSNNYGGTFRECASFIDFFIRNIFVRSESEMYVIGKQSKVNYWMIKGSFDGGKTWNDIGNLENDLQSPIIIDHDILYLTRSKNKNLIKKISLISGALSEVQLPSQISNSYFVTSYANNLFVVGSSEGNISIFKLIGNHFIEFSKLRSVDKFLVHMEIRHNSIYLILGERNSIGVTYSLYSKGLNLSSWDMTPIPSSNFNPFAFSESAIWGYSLDGQFYKKNLFPIASGSHP